jgi:hypothetical protein
MANTKQDKAPRTGVRLWAPDHPNGCHIGLTNGTTFMVPNDPEGIETPKEFVKPALAEGCIPVGMERDAPEDERFNRDKLVKEKMLAMYHSDDPNYMGRDGKPVLTKLSGLCGFNVDRADRDRLWEEVEADLSGKSEDA